MRLPEPVALDGKHVRLVPLSMDHAAALARIGLDPELWRLQLHRIDSPHDMRAYVERAVMERAEGSAFPFAIVWNATGEIVGSTRFADIAIDDCRLEIGWTWLAARWQRTVANTETKLLLLRHAFVVLGAERVALKTDVLNDRSRAAIERIGGRPEAIMRNHSIAVDGRVRDMIYYSILKLEWPDVEARLLERLARPK